MVLFGKELKQLPGHAQMLRAAGIEAEILFVVPKGDKKIGVKSPDKCPDMHQC